MSLSRLTWLGCLFMSLAFLGCANAERAKVTSVKRVYIENTRLSTNMTVEMITPAVLDTIAMELTRHGYVVVSSKASAEGVLRMSWKTGTSTSNFEGDCPLSLSMTLFNLKGQRIFSGNTGPAVPSSFWSQSRANAEVAMMLAPMPSAVVAAQ
jgi:hypothetical protein